MRKGFTLIEVLVSVAILSFIVAGMYAVLNMANKTYNEDMGLVDLQQEVRQAIDGMSREVRQGSRSSMAINGDGSLTFSIPNVSNITYLLVSNSHQIIRRLGGVDKVLSNDISTLSFCWWDGAACCTSSCGSLRALQINIDAAKTVRGRPVTFSLIEQVRLRN